MVLYACSMPSQCAQNCALCAAFERASSYSIPWLPLPTMDAAAIASLSIAIQQSMPAALEDCLRQLELARMREEDSRSYIAYTLQPAYQQAFNIIVGIRAGIEQADRLYAQNQHGQADEVMQGLVRQMDAAIGDSSDDDL